MDETIQKLRAEARQLARGKIPTAVRYSPAFRRATVAVVRARRGQGMALRRVARELGLPTQSLSRWLLRYAPPVLRPVAVAAAPVATPRAAAGPVLITPKGVRIEGLDRAALLAVLRALA